MSLPIQLALVCDGVNINASKLTKVASAISRQVQTDFGPIWKVDATVDAFLHLEDVPVDHWPIIIVRGQGGGYHEDKNGQPFAIVDYDSEWSQTASHECLEILADPWGRRLKSGLLLDQAVKLGLKPGRVRYLVEVCDPPEAAKFGYQINGVLVSDFYTPHFFDPVPNPGVRYSFTGAIDAPRKILEGGYISWHDPQSHHWMQVRVFPDEYSNKVPHILDLTTQTAFEKIRGINGNLRSAVDQVTRKPVDGPKGRALETTNLNSRASEDARIARAKELRQTISPLLNAPRPEAELTKPATTKGSAKRR